MSRLRESAQRHLASMGQPVGQGVGQGASEPVPPEAVCPGPVGQGFSQKSAENELCPTVPPLKARDSGTSEIPGDFGGTAGGTRCGTSAPLDDRIAAARLKEWHARLSRVDQFMSPPGWTSNQWLTLIDTAIWLYESFAAQAVRDGFSTGDLFGVRTGYPGTGGLIERLGDNRGLVMVDGRASWRSWGVPMRFNRGGGDGLPPFWKLGE